MPDTMTRRSNALHRLLIETRTMTIATGGDDGPWSAPVYFLYDRGALYFFSSPRSRHITQAMSHGSCAASIFHEDGIWKNIQGVQMAGAIASVAPAPAAAKILSRYLEKFPTAKQLFPKNISDLVKFTAESHTRLYGFHPEKALLVNNSESFGSRKEIELPSELS